MLTDFVLIEKTNYKINFYLLDSGNCSFFLIKMMKVTTIATAAVVVSGVIRYIV